MKNQLFLIALAIISLASCKSSKDAMEVAAETMVDIDITNTTWELNTLNGVDVNSVAKTNNKIQFTLHSSSNTITGNTGCNSFNGSYTLEEGNRIKFSKIGTTRKACPSTDIKEKDLMEMFRTIDNYTYSNGNLMLNMGEKVALAVFSNSDSDNITEKYWKLTTLNGKEVTMSKDQEREIFFMLKTKDQRLTGFGGCNSLIGTYTLEDGNRIKFGSVATTMKMCNELPVSESDFLKVFELADNYTIITDKLSLSVGRRAPLAVFEAVYF